MNITALKSQPTPARRWTVALILAVFASSGAYGDQTDNFDDGSKDAAKWGDDVQFRNGRLKEQNGRLEYTCASPALPYDASDRPWKVTRFPYNADWTVQIDVFNGTEPFAPQVSSFGINLLGKRSEDALYAELYAVGWGGVTSDGFSSGVETGGVNLANLDTGTFVALNHGAVRIVFNSTTKVVTLHYDDDVADGYQWVQYGSIGLAGSGGTDINTDWQLADTNQFSAFIYGYSEGMVVTSGQLYGDNFSETGGIQPSGSPSPSPTGSFDFVFPTNNPALMRMLSITGNYKGTVNIGSNRNYDMDAAEDESGKIAAMGTLDGLADRGGSTELSGGVGAIKTVAGQPTVELKTRVNGTLDGQELVASGTAVAPVKLVDIGGGTNGVAATIGYKGKLGGTRVAGKNQPISIVAPQTSVDNVKQGWNINLDIEEKTIRGKKRIVASAHLLLPNGDTIVFPEKVTKYSATKGYSLSFKRGTNVTLNPPRISRTSSITIKGMTCIKSAAAWEPAAGVITYQFLGQKGVANLLDFQAE